MISSGYFNFVQENYTLFRVWGAIYFMIPGIFIIYYALKTRNNLVKKKNPRYFINELFLGLDFVVISLIYPFLFDNFTNSIPVKSEFYFHFWDSITVSLIVWTIIIIYWNTSKKSISKKMPEEEWRRYISSKVSDFRSDFIRKTSHFLFAGILLAFHFTFKYFPLPRWNDVESVAFMDFDILVIFICIFTPFEIIRLVKFKVLGKFATKMGKISIYPDELDTYTAALPLMLTVIPFMAYSAQVLYCIALIASMSDSAASIVGKRFGKKRGNDKKTLEGYIAGFVSAYLFVNLVEIIYPFVGLAWYEVQIMAIGAATGFFLVDKYIRNIPDNFMNPLIVGIILIVLNELFLLI